MSRGARTDMIDKATKEIKQDDDKTVYKSLDEIADDLPDHSPRFILLSYPMILVRCFLSLFFPSPGMLMGYTRLFHVAEEPASWLTHRRFYSQDSGRVSVPYVLLFYLPVTCNSELRMLYAGAKELFRNTAEVNKVIDINSADDLEEIPEKLGAA